MLNKAAIALFLIPVLMLLARPACAGTPSPSSIVCESEVKAWLKVSSLEKLLVTRLSELPVNRRTPARLEDTFRQFRLDLEKLWSPPSVTPAIYGKSLSKNLKGTTPASPGDRGRSSSAFVVALFEDRTLVGIDRGDEAYDYTDFGSRGDCRIHEIHHRAKNHELDLRIDQACPDLSRLETGNPSADESVSSLQSIWNFSSSAARKPDRAAEEKRIAVNGIMAWFESRGSRVEWMGESENRLQRQLVQLRKQVVHAKKVCAFYGFPVSP